MDDFLGDCPNSNVEAAQIFLSLFQVLGAAVCTMSKENVWPADYGPKLLTEHKRFDYIIVGAGSAGATIAGRLSENPNHNILLIEAGEDPPLFTVIPMLYASFQKSKYDWEYYAEPSTKHSLEVGNGRAYIPRGKLLGGCSSINGMGYVRGNRRDYDGWEAKGNTGWGYDSVLEYFKKTEQLQAKELLERDQGRYHGTTGEMAVNYHPGFSRSYLPNAAKELGYDFKMDFNVENNIGFFKIQANVGSNGERCSPATAFLKKEKDNLHIVKNALVSKVLINQIMNKRHATGVELISSEGKTISARASREVIVSAGSINSPQLLLLSGIGPAKHLEKMNIPVIADLPVGLNLQDHFLVPFLVGLLNDTAESVQMDDADTLYDYLKHRKGALAGIESLVGFINSLNNTDGYPNLEMLFIYHNKNDKGLRSDDFITYGYSEKFIQSIEEENRKSSILVINVLLLNPTSVGEVKLRSSSPLEKPIVNPNYLAKKDDINVMLQAAEFVQALTKTTAMTKMGAKLLRPFVNRCEGLHFVSQQYWECYYRSIGKPGHHFAGSVKMGSIGDKTSVVNPQLKVHGVKGLRVADASIMPTIVSGNTNAATVMIGEKAADIIKKDSY